MIAEEKKGREIQIRDVRDLVDITDYFVLVTGGSRRQTQTIADEISKELKDKGHYGKMEGYSLGWWIVFDLGSVIVHVLQEEARKYYGLDHLWADAPEIRPDAPKKTVARKRTKAVKSN